MSRISDWTFRLRALLGRRSLESQVDQEFAFHVRMETEKLEREGWTPDAAASEARKRFGSDVRERERARDAWGVGVGYELVADARHALRQMRRRPGFSVLSILTLGLGIGATTALFAVVYGLLVRPLPFKDERLSVLWSAFNWRGAEYDHVREGSLAFEHIAAYSTLAEPLRTGPDQASQILLFVPGTANLFDALGAKAMLGRTFQPGEDRPGAEPVVVVSHGLWQQDLGGAEDVIGRRITIGGQLTTIVGVMPPGFYFPTPEFRAWRPLVLDPAVQSYHGNGWLALIGTAKAGTTTADVDAELARITRLLGERFTYPAAWDKTRNAQVTPAREFLLGTVREPLLLLLGAVALLLVIACANAAALILARTTDRTAELSVRVALGASHPRIARQILTESIALATIAAITGAVIASIGFGTLVASLPVQQGFGTTVSLGWQAFAIAFVLALAVGGSVAAVPVRQVLRGRLDVRERSEEGLRRGTRRAHAGLIVAQVTLAVMLVSGASLLIRSVERIRSIETGFDANGVVTLDLVRETGSGPATLSDQFYRTVLERVQALPGFEHAAFTNRLPVRDNGWQGSVTIEGREDLAGPNRPNTLFRTATPDYFTTLGMQVREGRGFDDTDRADGAAVILVSELFARRIWPGESAIGKRVSLGGDQWRTIVGVVEETRMTSMIGDNPLTMYLPLSQFLFGSNSGAVLVIRSTTDPASTIASVRALVSEMDKGVAVARAGTMDAVVNTALAEPLRLRFFLGLFAGLALLLGAVGVYGVVSYAVARRRAEFGIRLALGAAPSRVLTLVVSTGMVPVLLGATAGILASLGLSQLLRRFLFEVSPTDALSLVAAASAVLLAGAMAALLPAWRAGRVSPVESLRSD